MNSKNNNNSSSKNGESIFPCKLCPKNVTRNDDAVLCDLCQIWVHIKHITILTILTTNIYKVVMSYGIASLVPIHSFNLLI